MKTQRILFSTHSLITGTKRTSCAFCLSLVQCQQFLLVLGSSDITSVWIRSPAERPGTVQSELPPPANQIEPVKPNIQDSGTIRLQNLISGKSLVCNCGTSSMAVEHFLKDCQTHQNQGAETWSANAPVREKGIKSFCNHNRSYHTISSIFVTTPVRTIPFHLRPHF